MLLSYLVCLVDEEVEGEGIEEELRVSDSAGQVFLLVHLVEVDGSAHVHQEVSTKQQC